MTTRSGADMLLRRGREIVRLAAAARERRTIVDSATQAAQVTGHDAEKADATAGGEFVDDRIRLLE